MSRLVMTFLPRSKRLLISWLQSPSAVILEPQKIKSDTVSTVSPSLSHEVMGPVINYSEIESESEVTQSCPTLRPHGTVAYQAPQSMEFSRQEYWSGLPFPSTRGSSQPRDWIQVSRIAGRRFTVWATRGALNYPLYGVRSWKSEWLCPEAEK